MRVLQPGLEPATSPDRSDRHEEQTMNANTTHRPARSHLVGRISTLVVVGAVALGISGCQSSPGTDTPAAPAVKPVEVRPAGIEPHATADQIERALALGDSAL